MFIKKDKEEILGKKTPNTANGIVKYNEPAILMIDCDKTECEKLREKGFNIEIGSFGKKYKIVDQSKHKRLILNDSMVNIIEKDVVIIDMNQKNTSQTYDLIDVSSLEEGSYYTTYKNQTEFNPINISLLKYGKDFNKLKDKDCIFIIFADRKIEEKYQITKLENGYLNDEVHTLSNYKYLPFNIIPYESDFETRKYQIVAQGVLKDIFKNYKGTICSRCTFSITNYENKNTARLLENIYGDLIGYIQVFEKENKTKNTLIVLPQCEDMNVIIENILVEVLPIFYPEMLKDFVADNWMSKDEYLLPEIKDIIKEKQRTEEKYDEKLKEINQKIKEKQEENKFLYDIISSSGTGEKLVESIIKCLQYVGYGKVEDWDKVREDDEKEEDLHIYTSKQEYFIAEVKGVNGPAIEDDCNVIVKYKSRNCSKLKIPNIHGVVFVNYHKNAEPNEREELGFTQREIKDATRDGYTLVGTYQLFKAIRLYQEKIISSESIRKSLETPGIFRAIPTNYEKIGKIENILDRINVLCIPVECEKLNINDEVLIAEGNKYYKTKILSMMVDDKSIEEAKKGDKVGIKIEMEVPSTKSAQAYIIK